MDSLTLPVFFVLILTIVTPSDVSRSARRMLTTSLGLKRESCRRRTTRRSIGSVIRPTISAYSDGVMSLGFATYSRGGLRTRSSVFRHLRYRFNAHTLL